MSDEQNLNSDSQNRHDADESLLDGPILSKPSQMLEDNKD